MNFDDLFSICSTIRINQDIQGLLYTWLKNTQKKQKAINQTFFLVALKFDHILQTRFSRQGPEKLLAVLAVLGAIWLSLSHLNWKFMCF